jgi:protein TonB
LLVHLGLVAVFGVPVLLWRWFDAPAPETVAIEFREVVKAPPDAVPSIRASETARAAPGRAVFGASRRSLRTEATDAPAVRTGNTVTKEEDDRTLTDADPDALPSPIEEYLVERMPEVLADVRVPYPPEAKSRGVQGAVTLELLVDAAGNVRQATVLDGPGHGLNEAALEAARRFRFRPAVADGGKAVPVKIRYAYRFVLER